MPTSGDINGIAMADIADINGVDVPSGGGGTASTTPTLASMSNIYGTSQRLTITNYGSAYTDPHVSASVFIGGTEIVSNDNITNTDGVLSWSDTNSSTSTRTVKVRVQEFGDFVQSAEATGTYSKLTSTFRYFRCRCVDSSGNNSSGHLGVRDWRYTSSGTDYPSDMTSNTAPSPFVASAGHSYSTTYAPWKAFDSSTSGWWWSLTTSAANNYLDMDMGSSYTFNSGTIRFYSGSTARYVTISGSTDGTNYSVINDTLEMNLTNSDMTIL